MEYLQIFGWLVLACFGAALLFACLFVAAIIFRSWWLTLADAELRRAEAYAIRTQAVFMPASEGGAATVYDAGRSFYAPGEVNWRVPTSIEIHGSTGPAPASLPPASTDATSGPASLPTRVDLMELLRTNPTNTSTLDIILGVGVNGPLVRSFGDSTLHMGLLGASNSGKSATIQSICYQLALADPTARRVKFAWLDTEGVTSRPFIHAPHTLWIADDTTSAQSGLRMLEAEMIRRAALPASELAVLPLVAVVVEEFLSLRDDLDSTSWQRLMTVITKARKTRIYFLCASQAFYSDKDTHVIKGQLRTRIACSVEDSGTAQAFGIDARAMRKMNEAPTPGRFLLRTPIGLTTLQAPYITPEAIAASWPATSGSTSGPASTTSGVQEVITPEDTDIFKRAMLAYNNGHTSVRTLSEAIGVSPAIGHGIQYVIRKTLENVTE